MVPPTCHDPEGWWPISHKRAFDLTPCFEEGGLLSALLAVVVVTALLRTPHLATRQPLERSRKSWSLLWVKLSPSSQSYIFESVALLAAIIITYFNHTRTRTSSSVLLLFWPLYFLGLVLWFRTVVLTKLALFTPIVVLKGVTLALGLLSLVVETVGPEPDARADEKAQEESPVVTANIYSIWTFGWMTPLMRKGASTYVTENDLPPLLERDKSVNLGHGLQRAMKKHVLWKALFVAYGGPYAVAAGLKVIQDLLAFAQPQFLRWLLSYISDYQGARLLPDDDPLRPSKFEGFAIAVIMFVASVIQTIALNQYFQRTYETGMRVRAGLVTVIYEKALVLSNDERSRSSGDIVNLMSVDATRLQDLCTYGLIALSGPLQITLAFISLYNLLGWSAFVGVAIMILSVPLNTFIARIMKRMQEQQMKNRDKRTRLMSELLANIKSIKLYAWENTFIRRVLETRNEHELKMLRKIGIVTSLNSLLWSGIPILVAFSSFATAALTSSQPLTSDVIFPAMSLFMLLQFPLAMFAQVTSNIIEAMVSVRRLADFLEARELQPDARKLVEDAAVREGDEVLSIKGGEFMWTSESIEPTLEDINLSVKKGELVGVFGRVGAGKTSLLAAIIGDMTKREGEVVIRGTVAYAPQNPWILSSTVRNNILFSHEYDETFYNLVVEACALGPDLALLPHGDMTEVGEKGITLSGGQRARIALARAVYARADLTLLDDCLAAVDSHVARHLFGKFCHNVIGPNGILADKARVFVTNSVAFVHQFDHIAFIRRGIILEQGTYTSLMQNPEAEIAKLVKGHGRGDSSGASGSSTPFPPSEPETAVMSEDSSNGKVSPPATSTILTEKVRRDASFPKARIAAISTLQDSASPGLTKEHQEKGSVKVEVYRAYIQAASKIGFSLFLLVTVGQQAASVLATLTLRYWGEHNRETGSNVGMLKYLILYGSFSLGSSIFGGLSSMIMWVYCALRSARMLHDSMLYSLMRAPLTFFELTPAGRILNLFSRDTYVVDQILARVIQSLCRTSAVTLSIIIVIGFSFPPFLLVVPPLAWFYLRVMKYYLATSRELKRLDAVSRSPIFAWFSESLAGLSTIRAFNQQRVFSSINHNRVDRNQICYLPSISVNRWLAIRLEFVGAVIIFVVALLAMWALITTGVDAGLVGLVLSYALNTTSSLNWLVRSASEVEQNIVSVERILHQTDVEHEAPYEESAVTIPSGWPSKGGIRFDGYSARYRVGLDLVLRDVSLDIKPHEKIGICGRTGAGKSSLLLALFRIIEPASGTIFIDDVDITKLGLYELRSAISIVPQTPDLFEGTLRENIDPVGQYSDPDIWWALEQAHLKEHIMQIPGQLDAAVREGGSSLSSGQRQLLCFARALLRKTKILVLDEATSAVDLDTDKAIQEIIRGPAFKTVTILTIAHRLNTIIESDRVIVMDAGKVAEFESPKTLLQDVSSRFYGLVKEAGLIQAPEP
ncbi:metal resistance protein YCF1 [Coprinopsis cinerea okayama7|uniref:Metal resistance protein YCF1 n=1 Tax=Coprinopsis cinerea (strain Okayama-7 / 130 / ATCC MYA-4618 / FGSC 9003) TaxID=240176 RepID=A8N9M4_COPC7|nr:metal resistance protein YCF1 [Coprinopsis cinerea okayama7\|eukprot:XP_001831530.2 metal resistance protein YCF1 [Coprinopsis cinerea okayama7\